MTVAEIYKDTATKFIEAQIPEPQNDARLLMEYYLHVSRSDILLGDSVKIQEYEANRAAFEAAVRRRINREPLQYITGNTCFMGLDFKVDERVLIPRSDTEILVEEALRELHDGSRILDVCTGSGCILISLLKFSNDCEGIGIDISKDALEVAKQNADSILGSTAQASFCQGDLFKALEDNCEETVKFEMIVSNPPYIVSKVVDTLMPEVKDHEPRIALDGTETGIAFYERIVEGAGKYLTGGGSLFFEIGYDQGEAVSSLLKNAGYLDVKVVKDFSGLDRVVSGIKPILG